MTAQSIQADDLITGVIEDDDEQEAFSGVFDDDDMLRHNSFQSDMDAFARSRDFSMTETGMGEEDEFGVFECEPNNSSIVGSIDNHESFACCNSAPASPHGRAKTYGSTSAVGSGGCAPLLQDDLCNDTKPPITEVYVDFNDMGNSNSLSSSMYSSEDHDMQLSSRVNGTERHTSPRRTVSDNFSRNTSNIQDNRTPSRFLNRSQSIQNQYSSHESPPMGDGAVDDMFQQFTLEQLEPEPIVHNNHQHQNEMQHRIQQNHMLQQQQSYASPSQVSQRMPSQQMHQPHAQMQNMGMQRMPNIQNIQHPQYHTSPQAFVNNSQTTVAMNPSAFQQTPAPTMIMENNSNTFQMRPNHSSHGGSNFQGNQQSMMNNSSHGVPIPPNSQRLSRNSFQGHQPLTSQSYHGAPYRHNDGTMMNHSSHGPSSTSGALNSSFHRDDYQRRSSTPFKDLSTVGHSGMQVNVAIQPEHHSPQKYFNGGGYESPSTIHPKTAVPPTNMNDVMEKLSVSMRRSAMSRSMVKHISGRSLVSQNSARGLLASQGSSRGLAPNQGPIVNHHANRNMMKQGSERSFAMDGRPVPIRRLSTNAKHQPPSQSTHRNNSHRSLNHSSHAQVTLQIDDRNVGTF